MKVLPVLIGLGVGTYVGYAYYKGRLKKDIAILNDFLEQYKKSVSKTYKEDEPIDIPHEDVTEKKKKFIQAKRNFKTDFVSHFTDILQKIKHGGNTDENIAKMKELFKSYSA